MSLDVTIRHSSTTDLQDMVILMDQLGYPTTYAEMEERYTHISADANFTTLVAEARGRVVGLIGLQTSYMYEKTEDTAASWHWLYTTSSGAQASAVSSFLKLSNGQPRITWIPCL